jgi:hypothetical protein
MQSARWNVLPRWKSRRAVAGSPATQVRLLDTPQRLPMTPIEKHVIATLRESGESSFATLVKEVSRNLLRAELRQGAGVLDIGLLGSRLFDDEVVRELQAGDGVLWEIKRP